MRRRRDKDEGKDKQPEEPASVLDTHLEATTNGFVSDDNGSLLMWQSFMWQHTVEPVGSGFRSEQSSLPGASAVSPGRIHKTSKLFSPSCWNPLRFCQLPKWNLLPHRNPQVLRTKPRTQGTRTPPPASKSRGAPMS